MDVRVRQVILAKVFNKKSGFLTYWRRTAGGSMGLVPEEDWVLVHRALILNVN